MHQFAKLFSSCSAKDCTVDFPEHKWQRVRKWLNATHLSHLLQSCWSQIFASLSGLPFWESIHVQISPLLPRRPVFLGFIPGTTQRIIESYLSVTMHPHFNSLPLCLLIQIPLLSSCFHLGYVPFFPVQDFMFSLGFYFCHWGHVLFHDALFYAIFKIKDVYLMICIK